MNLEFHPLANLFPLIEGTEFDALVASIQENGQRELIVLLDGKILDGRNRYRACLAAQIEPVTIDYDGKDPVRFVMDMNLNRRHLNASQRAMIGAELCNLMQGQRADYAEKRTDAGQPVSVVQSAALMGVNKSTIADARRVLEEGTQEQIAEVKAGKTGVTQAAKSIRAKRTPEEKENVQSDQVQAHSERMQMQAQLYSSTRDALDALSGLPNPAEVVKIIRYNKKQATRIETKIQPALKWLQEFSNAWNGDNG